jgi:hypothetical protein
MARLSSAALVWAVLLFGSTAGAEIFRCRQADGSFSYTSDRASCPGAKPHRPSGTIQVVPGLGQSAEPAALDPGAPDPAPPPRRLGHVEDAQEVMWRRKRSEAERELVDIERADEELRQLVTWCNRGGALVMEDDVGLPADYSCEDARQSWEAVSSRLEALQVYLDGGLEDECRRAGCLPGWIR